MTVDLFWSEERIDPIVVCPSLLNYVEGQAPMTKYVFALNPGSDIYSTGYSSRGKVLQVGKGDVARIHRLTYVVDHLHSKWSQKGVKHGKRWQVRKAGARISTKNHQLVQDLHEKLARFLCTSFSIILLPKFQASIMIDRRKIKFEVKTAREHWRRDLIIVFDNACYRNRENIPGAE
jgi:hypothetical protein